FGQEVAQDGGAEAGAAVGWQQGDIHHADLVLPASEIEAPHGHRVAQNDEKARIGVLFLVELELCRELHVLKGGILGIVPIDEGQLLGPCAGIQLVEEGCVVGANRTKLYCHRHLSDLLGSYEEGGVVVTPNASAWSVFREAKKPCFHRNCTASWMVWTV